MTAPGVSVIMPTFNGAAYVEEAVRCVLDQTFDDFELIVVDDASTDDTAARVAGIADRRLRLVRNVDNLGIAATMNKVLAMARGRFVARCDQDDLSLPDRLAMQVAFLDARPDVQVVGTGCSAFGAHFGEATEFQPPPDDPGVKLHLLAGSGFIHNPTAMYRLSLVETHGLRYNPNYRGCDDYNFWVDAMIAGARFANIPAILLRYRWHGSNTTTVYGERMLADMRRIRGRVLRLYFPALSARTLDTVGRLWGPSWAATLAAAIDLVRAVDAAVASDQADWGQDQAWVRLLLTDHLRGVLSVFRDGGIWGDREAAVLAHVSPHLRDVLTVA